MYTLLLHFSLPYRAYHVFTDAYTTGSVFKIGYFITNPKLQSLNKAAFVCDIKTMLDKRRNPYTIQNNNHTLIRRMLITASDTLSTAEGKNRVTVSLTAPYRDTATNTRLAEITLPSSTYAMKVMNTVILLATKKEAKFSPRR